MVMMVTNRRIKNGQRSDEEMSNGRYDFLFNYQNGSFKNSGKQGFKRALLQELTRMKNSGINTPKVGLFIHGYNTDWKESISAVNDTHDNLKSLASTDTLIIGFSWPSSGKTAYYLSDREEARDSVRAFTHFLKDLNEFLTENERVCFSTSFCIAHSMGNYLLRKGMEYISDNLGNPSGRKFFDEAVLIAPDIASKDIELDGKGHCICNFSRRVHVYYSKHDRALKASSVKRIGQNRLGRHGANDYANLASNIVLVDSQKFANSDDLNAKGVNSSVHSSYKYHPDILKDISKVLSSIDRSIISSRQEIDPDTNRKNHYALT